MPAGQMVGEEWAQELPGRLKGSFHPVHSRQTIIQLVLAFAQVLGHS